jgi:hypothetical protein
MSEEKQKNKEASDLTDVGAFWKKTKNGKTCLSGKLKIGSKEFTAFLFSNNKSKPNQPDYRLTVSNLDEDLMPENNGSNKKSSPESGEALMPDNQDDIPF